MTVKNKIKIIKSGKRFRYMGKTYMLSKSNIVFRLEKGEFPFTFIREGHASISIDRLKISVFICGCESSVFIPLSDIQIKP